MNILEKITQGFAALMATLTEIKGMIAGKSDEALAKEVGDLKAKVASQEAELTAVREENSNLLGNVAQQAEAIALQKQEIATLKAAAKSAGERAADILAAQSIPPAALPASSAATGGDPLAVLRKQLQESTDPQQKFSLAMKIRELTTPKAKA